MVVPLPPVPKNEDKLEIVSISDDEENGALVKLNSSETCKLPSSKQQQQQKAETTPYSIIDAAIKTTDTSFVLEPVREEQSRPNKLSRSRAPLNQSKPKDSKVLLMSLDASPSSLTMNTNNYNSNSNYNHNSNNYNNNSEMMSQRNGACASTMLSSIPSSFSQSQNSSNGNGNNSSNNIDNSKNDGNLLPLNRLDSLMRSTQDTSSTTRSTMPIQSAVTSFANNVNSIEPELVLSPAKLGQ